jgi:hypothetical protein
MDVSLYIEQQPIDVKANDLNLIYHNIPQVLSYIQNESHLDIIYVLMHGSETCIASCLTSGMVPIEHENTTLLKLLCSKLWKVAIDHIEQKYISPDWNNYLNRSLMPCAEALNHMRNYPNLNFLSKLRIDIGTMTQKQIQARYDIHSDIFKNILIHSYSAIQAVYSDEYIYNILTTITFKHSIKLKIKLMKYHSSKVIKYTFRYADGCNINTLTKCNNPDVLMKVIDDENIRSMILQQWYSHHHIIVNHLINNGYLYPISDYFDLDGLLYNLTYTTLHNYSSVVDVILQRWPELHDIILYINYRDTNMDYFFHVVTKYKLDYDKILSNMLFTEEHEYSLSNIKLKVKLNCLIGLQIIRIDDERIKLYRSDLIYTTKLMWYAMYGKLDLVKSCIKKRR